jgi:hypothetical protein
MPVGIAITELTSENMMAGVTAKTIKFLSVNIQIAFKCPDAYMLSEYQSEGQPISAPK